MAEQDFYQVLGVARDADQDTIKKAYRKLAVQFHPDKNPGDQAAEEKFKEAASAYEILGNPEKRSQYDRFGHEAFTRARQGGGGHQGFHDMDDIFSSFSDIFGDFFGQGGGRQGQRQRRSGPQRGADLRYRCDITLKEVVHGAEKEIEFETEDACGECHGSGAQAGSHPETCTTCGGAGQVISQQGFFQMATTCPTCRGSGQIVRNPCRKCHGKGRQKAKRKIRVNIPAGVDTGTQLRVSGEGEGGSRGGNAGDLYVELRVKDDKRFERHGLDLVSLVEVSYLQALLGAEVEVETFDGAQTITIPNGTADGDPVRLDGKGIPSLRGAKRGDLVFQVKVNFPKKLKKDEEKLLREIAELKGENVLDGKKGLFR